MIFTLFITLIIEAGVVVSYCFWGKRPLQPILFTSVCGNLITQSLLWLVLTLFFQNYLGVLLSAETLIWIIESLILYSIPANHLHFKEAILLSLGMNASSFALGWFLPV